MLTAGSYQNGFAPRDIEPAFPQLWRGCIGAYHPGLGSVARNAIADASGLRRNAIVYGDPSFVPPALKLESASSQYVDLQTMMGKPANYTLSAWIRPTTYPTCAICSGDSGGADGSIWGWIFRSSGAIEVWASNGTSGQGGSFAGTWNSTYFPTTKLTHIASIVDGSKMKLFIGGTKYNEITQTVQNTGTPNDFMIGRFGEFSGFYFNGLFTDMRIYDRALNENSMSLLSLRPGIAYEYESPLISESVAAGFQAYWAAQRAKLIGGGNVSA